MLTLRKRTKANLVWTIEQAKSPRNDEWQNTAVVRAYVQNNRCSWFVIDQEVLHRKRVKISSGKPRETV